MKTKDKYEVRTMLGKETFTRKDSAVDYARWVYDNTNCKYIGIFRGGRRVMDFEK